MDIRFAGPFNIGVFDVVAKPWLRVGDLEKIDVIADRTFDEEDRVFLGTYEQWEQWQYTGEPRLILMRIRSRGKRPVTFTGLLTEDGLTLDLPTDQLYQRGRSIDYR